MSHQKMFVSTVFKTVFHLIFNAKIMSILEITFGISFICNDLDLTDILSKIENALSTAIYQSEVRQLEKNIKFTVRQFASKNSSNQGRRRRSGMTASAGPLFWTSMLYAVSLFPRFGSFFFVLTSDFQFIDAIINNARCACHP